ncbi:baculoviral IAP repeat-containing protein [Endozoicomonas ascidiicola]|uniref:baculoviral IAP repeat-containing protein n=1 Tax=Endozoicomonas ascidiicola TaxID=1698521 RepID=UPI0008376AF0|nr:baculoviral IAP repeat-containing protein [Endozoicomonas ascidiicola]
MQNIQGGNVPGSCHSSTNETRRVSEEVSRSALGHYDVGINNGTIRQTPSSHVSMPYSTRIFEFEYCGETYVAQSFDELLTHEFLLSNLRQSDSYSDYGQSVEQIASDVRSSDSLKELLFEINNISESTITRETPCLVNRQISMRDFDLEESSEPNTGTVIIFNEAMSAQANRVRSYNNENWQNSRLGPNFPSNVTDQEFMDSGFYSINDRDRVKCFSCGGGLQNWGRDEKPDDEHAQKYPKCRFIREKLGASVVDTIQNVLTPEQRQSVQSTIPGYQYLYSEPTSGRNNLRQVVSGPESLFAPEDEMQFNASSSSSSSPVSWAGTELPSNNRTSNQYSEESLSVNEAKVLLSNIINHDQMAKLSYLESKVDSARLDTNTYKEILNSLLKKPDLIGEVTEIIDSMLSRDCGDHTAEVCDQIKVRFKAASLTEDVCNKFGGLEWFSLLYKSKLLFHEDQLIRVLARHNLLGNRESTEIRGYVKNQLSTDACEFAENHIEQRYSDYGRSPVRNCYNRLKADFSQAISDKGLFKQYLVDLCKDDGFLTFISHHDEEFSQWLTKEDSNFEGLMDDYESNMGASSSNEQGYLAASGQLRETREHVRSKAIEFFLGSKVDNLWSLLVLQTHR